MKTMALTEARKNLFALSAEVAQGETVILSRRDGEDVALVSAKELQELRKARNQQKIDTLLGRIHPLMVELADK
ncbi:type II toxin-antitoxin system Phd/YefM family antitoxin [Citrobacter werkmanii]|uniref:type II toxin-antitoxin system Phd/YefM family antitoxin n=1 Tax=Citrobacter werkmanii TaxID=67827 RepID=UPI0037CBD057